MSNFLKFGKNIKTAGVKVTSNSRPRWLGTQTNFVMAASDNTFEKIKSGVIAASDYTFEKTKAGVVAASNYTFEKTKEGLAYAASDSAKHDVQQGLKTISKNIDAAADSLEKKEPTAWEKTKTGVSNTVDGVTQGVQEGWESLTAESKADSDKK